MTLNLAPYNDAMNLGQGFNSYTQQLCIDGAVKIAKSETRTQKNLSQVVSYSARLVEKLSDVVEGMNLSYCSSIKKGTVEVSGSTTTVNENSFKSSDLNAVISVKVTNQTIMTDSDAKFQPIPEMHAEMQAGSATFNQTYGDSYISGFVEGGEFTGIVSIKVIDRSKVASTVNSIKAALGKSNEATEVTFSPSDSSAANSLSSVMTGIESTISVAWMGGGQVKAPSTPWDLQSVLTAAAAFPANVAECPQRTWAILTKYKANRSFVIWSSASMAKTLEYDQINSYTAELFDHYMDYKLLLKHLQTIMDDRDSFQMRTGVKDALDVSLETLLSVKAVLRQEQSKIVRAVSVLSKDPSALQRQAPTTNVRKSTAVMNILAALGLDEQVGQVPGQIQIAGRISSATPSIDDETVLVEKPTPSTNSADKSESPAASTFNFASLIAPEIWENVMPVAKPSAQLKESGASSMGAISLMAGFKLPPPVGDGYEYPAVSERRAVQGMEADLASLRKDIQDAKQATSDATLRAEEAERARVTANSDFQTQLADASSMISKLNDQLGDARMERDSAKRNEGNVNVDLADTKQKLEQKDQEIARLNSTREQKDQEVARLNSTIEQKDKEIKSQGAQVSQLMNQILPPDQTQDEVNIIAVTYDRLYWQIGNSYTNTLARLREKARTREAFEINNQMMCEGQDPQPGATKWATIVYRRGNTGPVQILYGGERTTVQFS